MLKKLLDRLNGLYFKQEFLCLARESFEHSPKLSITDGKTTKDITSNHVFVGYKPVIFAIPSVLINDLQSKPTICFSIANKNPASLTVEMIQESHGITFYEGKYGKHHFLNRFHQFILSLKNRLYNKTAGNVFLDSNLLKQVQIAYAFPRTISLVTVQQNELFNLFPTDLHGQVNAEYYLISLRHNGKAAKQVMEAGNIILSEVEAQIYKTVYSLGKNHMQEMKQKSSFALNEKNVPDHAVLVRTLEVIDSFIHGIHRIFLFKILNTERTSEKPESLAHIHGVFASWLKANQLESNYLLR